MKIDKAALREATVDTMLGAIVNFPLSWLTITIVLLFTHNSFNISLSQWEKTMYEPMDSITGLKVSYPEFADLLPFVIICWISILSITLWLLIVWKYTQRRNHPKA